MPKVNHKQSFFLSSIIAIPSILCVTITVYALTIDCKKISKSSPAKECRTVGKQTAKLYGFTNMPYALCSKALCKMKHRRARKARCLCTLYKGNDWTSVSVAPKSFLKSRPRFIKKKQLHTVQSNYSLANLADITNTGLVSCHFRHPTPWVDCFGVRCKVTSANTATCLCPVIKSKTFSITEPGPKRKCVTNSSQVLSAVETKKGQRNIKFIRAVYKKFYPNSPISKALTPKS